MISIDKINTIWWQLALNQIGSIVEDYEDINQCIRIILTTPKGSVPHRPEFGSDIWRYIDYPVTEAIPNIIREAIDSINIWEPRVEIKNIKAEVDLANVKLKIEWILKETGEFNYIEVTV